MHIPQIRAALAQVAAGTPGIQTALPYPPRQVGPLPMAWVGELRARVDMGNLEIWTWRCPVTLVLRNTNDYGKELASAEKLLADLMERIRVNYQMFAQLPPNIDLLGLNVEEVIEGMARVGNDEYPGWTLVVNLQEIVTVGLQG